MKRAVVLLSGGVDSTTSLAIAAGSGFKIFAVSFDYGQRHNVELDSAKQCASLFGVEKHIIIKFDLRAIGGSALTAEMEVPKNSNKLQVTSNELKKENENSKLNLSLVTRHLSQIPVTYVPARNTIFLSFGLAFAESIGAEDIFIGANAVDYSGYPDCRPEFINAFEKLANLATKAGVEGTSRFKIHAPLLNLTKAEIIKKGIELGVDYSKTWSCYDPKPEKRRSDGVMEQLSNENTPTLQHSNTPSSYLPCGKCDSCLIRAKGFKKAGVKDPLLIKVKH